jgi:hypothetical protein
VRLKSVYVMNVRRPAKREGVAAPPSHHAAVVNEPDTVPDGAAHGMGGHDAIRSGGVISARDHSGGPTVARLMGGRLTTLR